MSEQILTPEIVTRPASEPLTLTEAKKHLEIAASDTSHDEHISNLITQAREQWERDTDTSCCYTTWRVKFQEYFSHLRLPKRPISSITSIQYYDGNNTLQTLSTSIYQLDTSRGLVRLAYQQVLPATSARWDAWTITYVSGYSADGLHVPAVAKSAMKLLIGHLFENRDMMTPSNMDAYESLVMRYMRTDYP